jgi:hypothetical protein
MNNTNILAKICVFSLIACSSVVAQEGQEKINPQEQIQSFFESLKTSYCATIGTCALTMLLEPKASGGAFDVCCYTSYLACIAPVAYYTYRYISNYNSQDISDHAS